MAKHFISQLFDLANQKEIHRFIANYPIGKKTVDDIWTIEHIEQDREYPPNPQTGEPQTQVTVTLDDGLPDEKPLYPVPKEIPIPSK